MKSTIIGNTCIRADRDELQIERCKSLIDDFSSEIANASKIVHLTGNEVRLKILLLLKAEQRLCVCDLSDVLNMKIPAVSQHLRKMKDASMVSTQREGTIIYYQISDQSFDIIESLLDIITKHSISLEVL